MPNSENSDWKKEAGLSAEAENLVELFAAIPEWMWVALVLVFTAAVSVILWG